jgi:hypothetical protein
MITVNTVRKFTREDLTRLIDDSLDTGYIAYWCSEGGEQADGTYHIIEHNDEIGEAPVTHVITPAKLERGIKAMAEQAPRHFEHIGTSREDAVTADVFVQCCCFGEIIYG